MFTHLPAPSRTGSRRREKKARPLIEGSYLDEALADFSGYIAVDELYDGPYCLLSLVDNRNYRRLTFELLDHDPTQDDIERFLAAFKSELDQRGLALRGVTTDGSNLYPEPLAKVFPGVSHQSCEFHIIKEINKSVLKAVAQVRRELKKKQPQLARGRPATKAARQAADKKKRLQRKIGALFEGRYLFVRHSLTPAEKQRLHQVTRGLPQLRHLRSIIDEVYRLFDRRCRTETALRKLRKLRGRVHRFKVLGKTLKKLDSPNLDKALTFLDDKLLPSTSNAVERGNRRHRKMQKAVYRVRSWVNIAGRIALDMLREARAANRALLSAALKHHRKGLPVSLLQCPKGRHSRDR